MIPKPVVLYMGPELLDRASQSPKGSVCGKCMMFLTDTSECSVLSPPGVSGDRGVCGLFVGGEPMTSQDHPPMDLVPADVAGYSEDAPTRCGTCRHYLRPDRCAAVRGKVHPDGCCNGYVRKGS